MENEEQILYAECVAAKIWCDEGIYLKLLSIVLCQGRDDILWHSKEISVQELNIVL
jgi:hypothetical protein